MRSVKRMENEMTAEEGVMLEDVKEEADEVDRL